MPAAQAARSDADLSGRAALVTGGGVGIGRAAALQLAAAGAFVGVHCNRSRSEAEETLAAIRAAGGDGMILQADLADFAQVPAIVDQLVAARARLDILVNNAGSPLERCRIEDCSLELWQQVLAVNLTGTFVVTQRAIPHLRASGHGAI